MKHISILALSILISISCATDNELFDEPIQSNRDIFGVCKTSTAMSDSEEGSIILGPKLENPYSVKNMKLALDALRQDPTVDIRILEVLPPVTTTHYYIRFRPRTEEELLTLKSDTTVILYEYPLDCEIIGDGVSYHDPELPDSVPTYQYASIEKAKWDTMVNTLSVDYDMLETLYIPDEDKQFLTGGPISAPSKDQQYSETIDPDIIELLVDKSLELTGNEEPIEVKTRGRSKWRPAGRITVYDDIAKEAVPLVRVRVRARRWFTTHIGHTDHNGYFSCNGRFERPANYSICWESSRFDIRNGHVVQASYNGPKKTGDWNLYIDGGKSLRFATIHRAATRFYYGFTNGLSRPNNSRKEKIAYIHDKGSNKNGDYNQQWGMGIGPDIRIFGKGNNGTWRAMSQIFSTTAHELGHAAHYTNAKTAFKNSTKQLIESWARCVQYHLTNEEYSIDKLNRFEALLTENNETMTFVFPDLQYNFQYWNSFDGDPDYTSIFIDLIDNNNQQLYFKYKYNDYRLCLRFPNDDIHLPISKVESIVFNSRKLEDVKTELESLASWYPSYSNLYGLSKNNINKLFVSYGK